LTVPEIDRGLLERVLEELPVGVVVADAASGRYSYANARARALLGESVVGTSVVQMAAEQASDGLGKALPPRQSPLARALFGGEQIEHELVELTVPGGEKLGLTVWAKPLRDGDGPPAAFAAIEDRSARDLRERVEREFITNAAHELRTPLAAIASAIEVLESGAKNLPAERDMFLKHIARQSDRLQRLTRALLLLARAEVHDEEPRLEIVQVKQLLADTASALTPAQGVSVEVDCDDDNAAALSNRDLLEQALLNIAANAARYTQTGKITLRCHVDGPVAVLTVEDTGPGISTAALGHVFERFYRAGSRESQGFGLGLSIARHAIEAIGGRVDVESTEGVGTRVSVRVPLARLVQP
jgi:two-component system phosphate regulon sensor histidine kinase PhoR